MSIILQERSRHHTAYHACHANNGVPQTAGSGGCPIISPRPDGVLIRVEACGVCRSDWHFWNQDMELKLPAIPGHEVGAWWRKWAAMSKTSKWVTA